MLVFLGGTPTWRLHTGLFKFVQNISTNIWSLGRQTELKLGEVSYLFISYNMIISWHYTFNGFQIIFHLRDSATQDQYERLIHVTAKFLNASLSNFTPSRNVAANLIVSLKKCYTFACVNQHWTCKRIPSVPRCLFRPFFVISVLILYFSLFTCDLTSVLTMESWWPRNVEQ